MKIIIGIFIFCLVLFIYLHIQFHLKTGDDLEMYEIEQPSKDKLEEICDLRQPVLFDFESQKIIDLTNKNYITNNYHAFEVKIRNSNDTDNNIELYMPLPLHSASKLFDEDKTSSYFSENNSEFLDETGIIKHFKYNDEFLKPYMVSNCNYDIMCGSDKTCTPLRYEINYRNYFLLTQGNAQVKMTPPTSTKYLYPNYDYENFEFRSPVNPWTPQPKYVADFDKIKCLEFTLTPGKTLFIPAYWWDSIKFTTPNTSISCFHYRTYMNNAAIIPYIALHALQIQNVKRNVVKKVSINELNNKIHENTDTTFNENTFNQNKNTLNQNENIEKNETSINNTEEIIQKQTTISMNNNETVEPLINDTSFASINNIN